MYSTYCYQLHQTHGVVKSHKIQFRLILQDTFNTTSKHKPSEFQCPEYQRCKAFHYSKRNLFRMLPTHFH